jgi:hypothetical protein
MSKNQEMTVSMKSDHFSQSYLLRAIVGSGEVGRLTAVIQSKHMILLGDRKRPKSTPPAVARMGRLMLGRSDDFR